MWSNDRNCISARVTVLGCSGVGKTALVVRYLTKRYIGDYISGTDITYKCELSFMRRQIEVQIVDTSGQTSKDTILNIAKCCRSENDILMLVYAMNDISSFSFIEDILPEVSDAATRASVLVIGNKSDLDQAGSNMFEDRIRKLEKEHSFAHMTVSAKSSFGDASKIFSTSVSLVIKKRSLTKSVSSNELTIQEENRENHDFKFPPGSRRSRSGGPGAKLARRATVDYIPAVKSISRLERRPSERLPSVEEDAIIEEVEEKYTSGETLRDEIPVSKPQPTAFSYKKRKKLPPVSISLSPTVNDESYALDCLVPKSAPLPTSQMPIFRFPEVSCAAEYRHASLPTSPDSGLKRNNSFLNKIKGALTAVPQRLRSPK